VLNFISKWKIVFICFLMVTSFSVTASSEVRIGKIIKTNKGKTKVLIKVNKNTDIAVGDEVVISVGKDKQCSAIVKKIKRNKFLVSTSKCAYKNRIKKGRLVSRRNNTSTQILEGKKTSQLGLSSFFSASLGMFEEFNSSSNIIVESRQNSPATLGVMGSYKFGGSSFSVNGSLYLSYLTASSVDNTTETINVPFEIGSNIYVNYSIRSWGLFPYVGFDFEKFASFNTRELQDGDDLRVIDNSLLFFSAGIGKTFKVENKSFLVKASISPSIISSSEYNTAFNGYKFILYLNTSITKRLLIHLLYKQHVLSGVTDLVIKRIGLGFGYRFF
jgi:hypothetical protein